MFLEDLVYKIGSNEKRVKVLEAEIIRLRILLEEYEKENEEIFFLLNSVSYNRYLKDVYEKESRLIMDKYEKRRDLLRYLIEKYEYYKGLIN